MNLLAINSGSSVWRRYAGDPQSAMEWQRVSAERFCLKEGTSQSEVCVNVAVRRKETKMDVRNKVYTYHTAIKWREQRKGVISCAGKPDIQVATPPEFKGHEGIWSPEDLFVASANICLMTTFLAVAERAGLATITLATSSDAAKTKELIEKAEANCLISNSMKVRVNLEPTIR